MTVQAAILLVDDIEANLISLEAQLTRLGCDIDRASSGNDALRMLLRREYAVVLLDVQMPNMDGYEVARFIRSNPVTREVPVIFVTAMHDSVEGELQGYGAGAVDYLFKPINPVILRSKVEVFIELYKSRRALAEEVEAHKETLTDLEAFNASVSHDLRAPLRPIEGFSELLLEEYGAQLSSEGRDYLERIRLAARRMNALIVDLLKFSRLGRAPIKVVDVDLAKLTKTIVAELKDNEPQRRVEVVCVPEAVVKADPGLMRIVLENLLRNAWKFTAKKPEARIELGKRTESEPAYFIRDNGAGFDPTYAYRLFQPFQRLHSTKEFEGTGIGLAIVQRIIRRHGGRVWAEGSVNEGACVFFTLNAKALRSDPS